MTLNHTDDEAKKTILNKELLESLKEREIIIQEHKEGKRKGYDNMEDLIKALNED